MTEDQRILERESLSQAGRRLARSLGDRLYADKSPQEFFSLVYNLRGRLVHPSGDDVAAETPDANAR